MAKLYFRYGVMGSSKTANALMVRYNYEERGQEALLVKPEIDQRDGKLLVSEILTAVMTSSEVEASQTWDEAEKAIHSLKLFDTAPEMDLMRLVFNQLQDRLIEIDIDYISELGYLYLNTLSLNLLRKFQNT